MMANYNYGDRPDNLLNSNLGIGIAAQGGGAAPTDNLNLEFDRGNSDLVVPNSAVIAGLVTLPVGFWMSGVFRASSGAWFSAAGTPIDYDGDGIVSTRPPNTKRNQFSAASSANLHMRIQK